jgi:cytochrome c553
MNRLLLLAVIAGSLSAIAAFAQAPSEQPPAQRAGQSAGKPDVAKAQTIVKDVCSACHGLDGNSVTPANPSVAAQPAEYITLQLAHFRSGLRVNPVMQAMATPLQPEDIKALGVYFSQQKPSVLGAKDAALATAGQKLFRGGDAAAGIPACAACHAPNGAGIPKNYPRLAGQHADYTLAQLKAFKAGERGQDKEGKDSNGRIMATVAAKMSEAQMKAVAEYASGLR